MRKLALLLALTLMLTCTGAARAETAADDAASITDCFDAAGWSFGGLDWLTPVDDYLMNIAPGDEPALTVQGRDLILSRNGMISEYGREFTVQYCYQPEDEGLILCQIKLFTRTDDREDYLSLVATTEDVFAGISAKIAGADALNAPDGAGVLFDDMRALAGESDVQRSLWTSSDAVAEYGGKPLLGVMSIYYGMTDGVYELGFTFGIAPEQLG